MNGWFVVFWAAVMGLIWHFNIPTSPLSADFIKEVVSGASELLFMQKLCRIFIARKSKYSMKQALMLSMAILFCAVPTVMGMQGGEIQWAQQSLIADVVNLGGEMAINYLSKKQKVLGQVGYQTWILLLRNWVIHCRVRNVAETMPTRCGRNVSRKVCNSCNKYR